MSRLAWYWHRLRAMSPGEMALHLRKQWRQAADARRSSWPEVDLACAGVFPKLPKPEDAPQVLREALRRDVEDILAGRWKFFGHLELQVDDPPKWQFDYLVRREMATDESAFKLNYRSLPEGVDSKLIWEPSRWYQLVRLAMAAHVLRDARAAAKCVEWLEDWVKHNTPYRGWNWTSALEVGMRLVQFTWIDALLTGSSRGNEAQTAGSSATGNQRLLTSAATMEGRLARLRRAILPPHVWYAWRHQSFGSSANNHLLGELTGCILATVRWPGLAKCGASLDVLQARWQREVLAQFAEDGGNKEQGLNYHLFSWEFCWQARMALVAAGRSISPEVDERLRRAARFFVEVQVPSEPWDYGDSDNGFVTPFFSDATMAVTEWHEWFGDSGRSLAIKFWCGDSLPLPGGWPAKIGVWMPGLSYLDVSGQAVVKRADWTLRLDGSPLGYLETAAHGHLDSTHLSLWRQGIALVIDPGTGAYHADKRLRNWLASRSAHNCPCPPGDEWPRRSGPFLWASQHGRPGVAVERDSLGIGLCLREQILERQIVPLGLDNGFSVEDKCWRNHTSAREQDWLPFSVRWQFAPESRIEVLGERRFHVTRRGVSMEVEASADWAEVFCVTEPDQVAKADPDVPLAGTVSPAFRKLCWAPYLKLTARRAGDKPCVFRTTFLASAD